jgi:hypothetical protein
LSSNGGEKLAAFHPLNNYQCTQRSRNSIGGDAIPMLLRELERIYGRWFWALKSISRGEPVTRLLNSEERREK